MSSLETAAVEPGRRFVLAAMNVSTWGGYHDPRRGIRDQGAVLSAIARNPPLTIRYQLVEILGNTVPLQFVINEESK